MAAVQKSEFDSVVVKQEKQTDDVMETSSVHDEEEEDEEEEDCEEDEDMDDDSTDTRSDDCQPDRQRDAGDELDMSEASSPAMNIHHSGDDDLEDLEETERKFVPRRSARVKSKFMKIEEGDVTIAAGLARYYGTRFQASRVPAKTSPPIRGSGDLPADLKQNLKQLKNFLKLNKARRWVYFEFFYSDLDRELFLGPSEFSQCLQENFPLLRQQRLRLAEWKHIKRLVGKPRRLSQVFLAAERQTIEKKRNRIREIQKGSTVVLGNDLPLPNKIPRPLTVGSKVFAKIQSPKDGLYIYPGTVNAVVDTNYRITFEKPLQPHIVADVDVMAETPSDLVSVSFFLEKNKAAQPLPFRSTGGVVGGVACQAPPIGSDLSDADFDAIIGGHGLSSKNAAIGGDVEDKCGNYSLRVVTVLTKLHKLLERKRMLMGMLRQKNIRAEHAYLTDRDGRLDFDSRLFYAKNLVKIRLINEQLEQCLSSVADYVNSLLSHLSEVTLTSRPKTLRKLCLSRATQIFKQTNVTGGANNTPAAAAAAAAPNCNMINRESAPRSFKPKTSELIIAFCALALQLKALCQEPGKSSYDFCTVREAVREIKSTMDDSTKRVFEDLVELVIRHIELCVSGEDPALLIR